MDKTSEKPPKNDKTIAGMPVGTDLKGWYKPLWNKKDDTLFPPKAFGIGWTINFHALLKKAKVIK